MERLRKRGRRAVAIAGLGVCAAGASSMLAATGSAQPLGDPSRVTIFSRPGVLFGSVDGARAGETVSIQAKDCGQKTFRVVSGAETHAGGQWSIHFGPGINSTVRAWWRGSASPPLTMREPVRVTLHDRAGRRMEVFVTAQRNFWRKRVRIQHFARRLGAWTTIRWVVLTDTYSRPGSPFTSSVGRFTLRLPRDARVRAVVPRSEARPCYVAGTSPTLRFAPD